MDNKLIVMSVSLDECQKELIKLLKSYRLPIEMKIRANSTFIIDFCNGRYRLRVWEGLDGEGYTLDLFEDISGIYKLRKTIILNNIDDILKRFENWLIDLML